jgi:hypothetical protein
MADATPAAGTPAITFPTGQQIYDTIMGWIEPDLVTAALPLVAEKYKNETPQEKKERTDRYALAYEAYDKVYAVWSQRLGAAVAAYRRAALQGAEQESTTEESGILSQLESSMTTTLPSTPSHV